ncbi:hypothetical protein K2173_009424 [Erythroxylum novogranatense]|uniref:Uncharacterized protein n=1 Tax=Erythroxylum novogranatense TaxID=1862640 RepID=A0AAV8U6N2_9ROSI|nr:hypothetical protein K2173_009424 [Erythroxylum novogranatense]
MQSTVSSNPFSIHDEKQWVITIKDTLKEVEAIEDTDCLSAVSIYSVPNALRTSSPDSYTPQVVAIGPYHQWRHELYDEMQRVKIIVASKTTQKEQSLQDVVDKLKDIVPKIRACYHKFLSLEKDTFAWLMAIDASFLLEFMHIHNEGKPTSAITARSGMSHLVDDAVVRSSHNSILKDIVMLENQIPLFVLSKMLEVKLSLGTQDADERLHQMLVGISKQLCPFKTTSESYPCAHLLDYLYHMIVPKGEECTPVSHNQGDDDTKVHESAKGDEDQGKESSSSGISSCLKRVLGKICKAKDQGNEAAQKEGSSSGSSTSKCKEAFNKIANICTKLNKRDQNQSSTSCLGRLSAAITGVGSRSCSFLPCLWGVLGTCEKCIFPSRKEKKKAESEDESSKKETSKEPPSRDEVTIPTVIELSKIGIIFSPTTSTDFKNSITFDPSTRKFTLPTITLDVNSEVVLRNLVAYEAAAKTSSGALILTRYAELMNGIVNTVEDVRLLQGKGIILNRMNSDEEVAKLWNGMSKSIKLTGVPELDEVIKNVNKYYNGRCKVKAKRFLKGHGHGLWQTLKVLIIILAALFFLVQSICSVYKCPAKLPFNH